VRHGGGIHDAILRAERTIGDVTASMSRSSRERQLTRKSPSYSYQHEHRIVLLAYGTW
jgi:hypothetical protein